MSEFRYAHQLDFYGIYVGDVVRQKSPLESDVWLIPGGAVIEPALPSIPEGSYARLVDGVWQIINQNTYDFIHNAYRVDGYGIFLSLEPRSKFLANGVYTYPEGVISGPILPVLAEGEFARFVDGVWLTLTQEEVDALRTPTPPEP